MFRLHTTILVIVIFIVGLSSCTTHYYIVRHAEKANSTSNTPLSGAGETRADDLRDYLADKGIDNIYVSQYLRTQQTAEPTATLTGLTHVVYDVPSQSANLITQLKTHGDNRSILVVNHSTTVPNIIDELMNAPQGIVIQESEFDNIYHVRVKRCLSTTRHFNQINYGQPTN